MSPAIQMRVMIVLWCAAGMVVSYVTGYELMYHDLQDAKIDALIQSGNTAALRARVEELRSRSADRDRLELGLRSCHASVGDYVNTIEDVKWQMSMVIKTCPGRERPPKLPRP